MRTTRAREVRQAAGRSQEWTAVQAGTSAQLVRLFEVAGPEVIADRRKREALEKLYADFETSRRPA